MRNEILYDAAGVPDIMVTFTPEELGLPAVLKGRKVAEYLIGKYISKIIDDTPHSLPYQEPAVNVSHDEAIRLCEAKGPGWHLITNDEWAALALQSLHNHTLPHGNTNLGRSHAYENEHGIMSSLGFYIMTLTGSGPITWNHDHTAEGVADMCGDVWEHVGGIRFLDGQLQVIPDNGAAAGADQSRKSKEWKPILTAEGKPVYYIPDNNGIKIQADPVKEYCYGRAPFIYLDAEEPDIDPDTLNKLKKMALYPEDFCECEDDVWVDNSGESVVVRGGNWNNGPSSGVFSLFGLYSRGDAHTAFGFRLAYIRYSDDSGNLEIGSPTKKEGGDSND